MNYPFWDVGLGYGPLMGGLAVFHVFISHFAIGGGLYLVVSEWLARRRGDREALEFLEGLSRFFVLTTLVMGALTGVGIWFVIGLLNPAATEVLIHHYVWGWAIEWTFFVLEITAAILYLYGWRRTAPRAHLTLGWIYFVAAWLSLFVINGILTFMLTPGEWLRTGAFLDGFFNPTFWPVLWLRTGICLTLAGLYVSMVLSRRPADDFRTRQVRHASLWGLAGLVVAVPCFGWFWARLPEALRSELPQRMPTPVASLDVLAWTAGALALVFVVFGLVFPRRLSFPVGLAAMVLGLTAFGGFEWFRESVRKPWVITGYMYGNGVEVARLEELKQGGMLPAMAYRTGDDGADLFRRACRSCHTLRGYKALGPFLDGLDPAFLAALIQGSALMKATMPPFAGTAEEAATLADYLARHSDRRPLAEVTGLSEAALGEVVWQRRCGACHQQGGPRDVFPSLDGWGEEELSGLLDMASVYGEGMPDFTGDDAERAALMKYLIPRLTGKGGGA